jgi:hypothetical protein
MKGSRIRTSLPRLLLKLVVALLYRLLLPLIRLLGVRG